MLQTRTDRRLIVGAALAVLAVLVAAVLTATQAPRDTATDLKAAPAELGGGYLTGADCAARLTAGTTGLSAHAVAWLEDCVAALGSGPTGSPSASPTVVPTSPSPSMSPTATQPPSPSPTVTQPSPTPSSSPTPTPTSGLNNCFSQLAACGFPHAANTGVPAGTTLTVVNGNVTLATAGTVYEGKEVHGCVEVRAANITIRNSRIAGNCFWAINNFSTGLSIVDTTISCGTVNGTGIGSSNLTALRVNIFDCENGFNVSGNLTVRDSYVHDLEAGGGAHTDGAQFNQGASNITFRHNTMLTASPGGTAAIIMWDEGNPQNANVLIAENLLGGGTYSLYCARQGPVTNVRIVNNRIIGGVSNGSGDFIKDPGGPEFGTSNGCTENHVTEFAGNLRDMNGALLAV